MYDIYEKLLKEKGVKTAEDIAKLDEAFMADKYVGTVTCREGDVFDAKAGEGFAVKKAMDNHKNAFAKAIIRWQTAMLKDIIRVSPKTFGEALKKAQETTSNETN